MSVYIYKRKNVTVNLWHQE